MKITNLYFTIIVCAILIVMQTTFIIIPSNLLNLYNMTIRPLTYTILTIAIYVFIGRDLHIIRHADLANKLALLLILMFGFVMILLAFGFGVGNNSMVVSWSIMGRNLWELGLIIILGDYIRYKLIKNARRQERRTIIFMLTVTLVYSQVHEIHQITQGNMAILDAFFELIFSSLVISSVVSYFAIKGSFLLVASVSFIYTMTPYLIPVLPSVSLVAFSLITSGLAFTSAIIYYFLIDNYKPYPNQIREKRAAKYSKKTLISKGFTVLLISSIIVFATGRLPIYPIVVLTESMTGTFNRGSLVFVERLSSDDVFYRVDEGTVIHFVSHTGIEYIHRVIDMIYDDDGERQYITQGDAVYLADPFPVPQSNVQGIAHAFLPYIGYPVVLLNERR